MLKITIYCCAIISFLSHDLGVAAVASLLYRTPLLVPLEIYCRTPRSTNISCWERISLSDYLGLRVSPCSKSTLWHYLEENVAKLASVDGLTFNRIASSSFKELGGFVC